MKAQENEIFLFFSGLLDYRPFSLPPFVSSSGHHPSGYGRENLRTFPDVWIRSVWIPYCGRVVAAKPYPAANCVLAVAESKPQRLCELRQPQRKQG